MLNVDQTVKLQIDKIMKQQNYIPIDQTEPQDIFIAGFPKSGNTWVQNLISGIIFGISTEFLPDRLTQELVPDVHYKKYYKRFFDFNCFKTHDEPLEKHRRVIYLVRDPRDVIVSYYYYLKNSGNQIDYQKMIYGDKSELSQWINHAKSWRKNSYKSEIMLLKYEDLLLNPMKEMKRVIEFMKIERNDETLLNSIQGNSFKEMRIKEESLGFDNEIYRKKWNNEGRFFRKGIIGSYKEELTLDLIRTIEERAGTEMEYLDYS